MPIRPLVFRLSHLAVVLLLFPIHVSAERDWHTYENGYFVAHSNSSQGQTLGLLHDVERFRAAVTYVSGFSIPAAAEKTEIIIVDTSRNFRTLTTRKDIGGFAYTMGPRTLIVMPASRGSKWGRMVIRHEYTHALLKHRQFRYPAWYEEGFAEIAAATRFVGKSNKFRFGEPIERTKYPVALPIDWDDLLSQDFRLHGGNIAGSSSDAYFQAWLLAHYATFGDDLKNAYRLQHYFNLLKQGYPSLEAFETSYEVTEDLLWNQVLLPYSKRVPVVIYEFEGKDLDFEFAQSPGKVDEIEPKLDFFRTRAIAYKGSRLPRNAISTLDGEWDTLDMDGTCSSSVRISVDAEGNWMTFESFGMPEMDVAPRTVSYRRQSNGVILLPDPFRDEAAGRPSVRLSMRDDDVFCVSPEDWPERSCGEIMRRCGATAD